MRLWLFAIAFAMLSESKVGQFTPGPVAAGALAGAARHLLIGSN